jgi:hypothetical protein
LTSNYLQICTKNWSQTRALPDITSGLEAPIIFKILVPPGRRTFNTVKNIKKSKKKIEFLNFQLQHNLELLTPNLCPGHYPKRNDNPYLVCKMFRNISPDLVRCGRTCRANLCVRSCPVRKLICPVRLNPISNVSERIPA